MNKNAKFLILFSAVMTSSLACPAMKCPELEVNDVKWHEGVKPYIVMQQLIDTSTYTWQSEKFGSTDVHAISAIHTITHETNEDLRCKYEVDTLEHGRRQPIVVDVSLTKIDNFYPANLDAAEAQQLATKFLNQEFPIEIKDGSYTWELKAINDSRRLIPKYLNKVEFQKNSDVTRGGQGPHIFTFMYFISTTPGEEYKLTAIFRTYLTNAK